MVSAESKQRTQHGLHVPAFLDVKPGSMYVAIESVESTGLCEHWIGSELRSADTFSSL